MPVDVIGNYKSISRRRSGIFSLDLALANRGDLGIPMRTIMEIYGYSNVGKSTLSYYLGGVLTGNGNYTICDVENADREYIRKTAEHSGMNGTVKLTDSFGEKGKPISHEDMLMDMANDLYDEKVGAVILDSVGMIQPIAEASGEFGEAFMGKRAKLIAQMSRSLVNSLRNKDRPSIAIIVNHVHSIMGGRGHTTAGGETLRYATAMRMMLWPVETLTVSEDDVSALGFLVGGKVEKLRYGGRGRNFQFYIVPDYGVHVGATAMFDCFELGIAERSTTVKLDGKSLGYLKKDLLNYASDGKQRKFDPFVDALSAYEKTLMMKLEDSKKDDEESKTKATVKRTHK
jgi:RecA/RadA recombinase